LRKAVHRLKYEGDISLADILARPMLSLLRELKWTIDILVPVPTSESRRAERGYNQAALLAYPLALGSGIPYRSRALYKVRQTDTQVGLNFPQRRANVAGAFLARAEHVGGRRVLVVDDIMTSGATIEECSKALKDAGAAQVFGLTLAQAGLDLSAEPDLLDV
jgi:ComF family protein